MNEKEVLTSVIIISIVLFGTYLIKPLNNDFYIIHQLLRSGTVFVLFSVCLTAVVKGGYKSSYGKAMLSFLIGTSIVLIGRSYTLFASLNAGMNLNTFFEGVVYFVALFFGIFGAVFLWKTTPPKINKKRLFLIFLITLIIALLSLVLMVSISSNKSLSEIVSMVTITEMVLVVAMLLMITLTTMGGEISKIWSVGAFGLGMNVLDEFFEVILNSQGVSFFHFFDPVGVLLATTALYMYYNLFKLTFVKNKKK